MTGTIPGLLSYRRGAPLRVEQLRALPNGSVVWVTCSAAGEFRNLADGAYLISRDERAPSAWYYEDGTSFLDTFRPDSETGHAVENDDLGNVVRLFVAEPRTAKYLGYHEDAQLPFRRGQELVVPAGTPVVSTHPERRRYETTRRQTVRVHTFGCGRSFRVGLVSATGERRGCLASERDRDVLEELYGSSDPGLLVARPETVVVGHDVFLPVSNPTVLWVGTGNYWCEVDLNLLLEANGVAP